MVSILDILSGARLMVDVRQTGSGSLSVGGYNSRHRLATEARDLRELADRGAGAMRNSDHVVANPRFLRGPIGTQAHHDESSADLTGFAAPVLFHRRGRGGHVGCG